MIIKIVSLALLASCSPQDGGPVNDESFRGKVILFDFYDADVKLSIGENVAFDGHLHVSQQNESTGLSLALEIEMAGCEEIVVNKEGQILSSKMMCPDRDGFEIYINPNVDPKIKLSYDPAFGLD